MILDGFNKLIKLYDINDLPAPVANSRYNLLFNFNNS